MTKYSWNQPICERCWLEHNDNWTDNGIRIPTRIREDNPRVFQCAYCGYPTFVGIFVRDDPANVMFVREEDE